VRTRHEEEEVKEKDRERERIGVLDRVERKIGLEV